MISDVLISDLPNLLLKQQGHLRNRKLNDYLFLFFFAVLSVALKILTNSFASFIKTSISEHAGTNTDSFATSSQYKDSSASSTTISILYIKSAFGFPLQAAW